MAAESRSLTEILQDTIRNVQEIVRLEVRLAKTEVREELAKAKASTVPLGAGAVTAIYAGFFLLLAAVYGLALVMPEWAAALIVGAALAGIAAVLLTVGRNRFRKIHATPERTVETIRENVEWAKQQVK
jgi:hypothetical protein